MDVIPLPDNVASSDTSKLWWLLLWQWFLVSTSHPDARVLVEP
jgi:hypothetical protein